jgi:GMP synthase-like glutamine amidotransferase
MTGSALGARVLVVQHQATAPAGIVGERLAAAGIDLDTRHAYAGDPLPAGLSGYDGLLVLGGAMGPLDDDVAPWLPRTRELLRDAAAADLPTLGVCLGHELLAVALGGRVGPAAVPELGLVELRPLPACAGDVLLAPLAGRAPRGVEWHYEEVTELPAGAVPLMASQDCAWQAFRVGRNVWGVQWHPEVDDLIARDWVRLYPGAPTGLGLDPAAVEAEIRAALPDLRDWWGGTAGRWGAVVTGAARRRSPARGSNGASACRGAPRPRG